IRAAGEVDVVISRLGRDRGRQHQARNPERPTHCAAALRSAAIRARRSLNPMVRLSSFTGRPVARSSISSGVAARVTAGFASGPAGSVKSPWVRPTMVVSFDFPVNRKRTYSEPAVNAGAPANDCRRLLAVPPGITTSTDGWLLPLYCSET